VARRSRDRPFNRLTVSAPQARGRVPITVDNRLLGLGALAVLALA